MKSAVEIDEAVSALVARPTFEAGEFPYAFLEAFGRSETLLKQLRARGHASKNRSDIEGAVLERGKIHLCGCAPGQLDTTLAALRDSRATQKHKATYILATDGQQLAAEDLKGGSGPLHCTYAELAYRFGYFLPLAGITITRQIGESTFDVKATRHFNTLYVQILRDNPDWSTDPARRAPLNQLMVRLIFCYYAEATDIFFSRRLFTDTLAQMTAQDGADTRHVLGELFRAMDLSREARDALPASERLPAYADQFPWVNGGLFHAGHTHLPKLSRSARGTLLGIGELDWQRVNPDIFGSMIQAVADPEARSQLGMHYTSVPNILKVLNPLFLDSLRADLSKALGHADRVALAGAAPDEEGEDASSARLAQNNNRANAPTATAPKPKPKPRALRALRSRLARLRVFDPACGSGNFLVIAYKQLRKIELQINTALGEAQCRSTIPLENFRGMELEGFPVEIARLALLIAQYQCDIAAIGQLEARAVFLPLPKENFIYRGNALRHDWLALCPPSGTTSRRITGELALDAPSEAAAPAAEVAFTNTGGGETYICGNPPYRGSTWQSAEQKADMREVFAPHGVKNHASLDYVAAWFFKASGTLAAAHAAGARAAAAFVATNSIVQGTQASTLWAPIFARGLGIAFAHTSFKWANLASHKAGVTVVIVGLAPEPIAGPRRLWTLAKDEATGKEHLHIQQPLSISATLRPAGRTNAIVSPQKTPLSPRPEMIRGNMPTDGGHLLLSGRQKRELLAAAPEAARYLRRFLGSEEFIQGKLRYCLWIRDDEREAALAIPQIAARVEAVRQIRLKSPKKATVKLAVAAHRFDEVKHPTADPHHTLVVPRVSSEHRPYLPVGLIQGQTIVGDRCFALYDAPLWCLGLLASRLHLVWVAAVCGKLETRYSYSNTLGWHAFPFPEVFMEAQRAQLAQCAETILLAREEEFPKTLAELYRPGGMTAHLRHAHAQCDEAVERIYIGRHFKSDSERLEHLFSLYARQTGAARG